MFGILHFRIRLRPVPVEKVLLGAPEPVVRPERVRVRLKKHPHDHVAAHHGVFVKDRKPVLFLE